MMKSVLASGRVLKESVSSKPGILLTDTDTYLFNEGTHYRLYEKMGAHRLSRHGEEGVHFAVWAPNAAAVSVIVEFNNWNPESRPMKARGQTGLWDVFVPDVPLGALYKYHVASRYENYRMDKADPFAFASQTPPKTASVVTDLDFTWTDQSWMKGRRNRNPLQAPISIYEVHLGSWMRRADNPNQPFTYRDLARLLADYLEKAGFTHVEFLPIMEHPFGGSWGYQTTGYFAPTSRFGTPQDLMFLVDTLHQHNIGVILDWVPSHFPNDAHGLTYFDGTHLFEHADPKRGFHPDWKSSIFNYGRNEVRSFLISSAVFWLDKYHIDGLRVDGVASMLYLDYSRKEGEWIPNQYGGRENIDAIEFLRKLNEEIQEGFPDVQTFAEESTAWPRVSGPTSLGGLGFGFKWDMGWMNDMLGYMHRDPIDRRYHQDDVSFRMTYAFSENFVLPLSHDEVVHGKSSLLEKMPGNRWQKFANLRLLLGTMFAQPGKKLLFMGSEIGQEKEWNHDVGLEWHLLSDASHSGVQKWVKSLNRLYRSEPSLHERDCDESGFHWINADDTLQSVVTFFRTGKDPSRHTVVACNFTPVPRERYRVGVPSDGYWKELLNSDTKEFGGGNMGNGGGRQAESKPWDGYDQSILLTLPPLSVLFLRNENAAGDKPLF